jgi:5'-nucleotidase
MVGKTLRILHFNDAYEIDKTPYFLRQWSDRYLPDTIGTFSGDMLNPSFASMFMKGEQFIPFLKRLPLDAAVIGNHELDSGIPKFLEINGAAPVPWMCLNYVSKETGSTLLGMPGTMVKEVNGIKVGLVGIVDQSWKDTTSMDHSPYRLEDPIETCRIATATLRAQGCDFVIVLTHTELETDIKLLQSDLEIDLVLGGHNHIYLAQKMGSKLLVKSGCDFKFFTEIVLEVGETGPDTLGMAEGVFLDDTTKDSRTLTFNLTKTVQKVATPVHVTLIRHKVDFKGAFDPELKVEVDAIDKKLSGNNELPMAFLEGDFDMRSMVLRISESAITDLATDLVRIILGVDIALIPSGHVRAEKHFPAKYIFRLLDLLSTFPIHEIYVAKKSTGQDLLAAMEEGIQHVPQARGSYPNVSGMRFVFRADQPPLSRICRKSTEILGRPMIPERQYTLATINWIASGGDGYTHMLGLPDVTLDREVSTLDCFKILLNLPSFEQNREEFALVKPLVDQFSLEQLLEWRRAGHLNDKLVGRVTAADLTPDLASFPQLFKQLTHEASERLLMYRLPKAILNIEGTHVFSFDNQIGERVKRAD